jgi:hypothetical protein
MAIAWMMSKYSAVRTNLPRVATLRDMMRNINRNDKNKII